MDLNASSIFNRNISVLTEEMGVPESSRKFRESYIVPAFTNDHNAGAMIESMYMDATTDYQESAFVVGFNTAMQFMMGCMPGQIAKLEKKIELLEAIPTLKKVMDGVSL